MQALTRRYEEMQKRFEDLQNDLSASFDTTLEGRLEQKAAEHRLELAKLTKSLEETHSAAMLDAASRTREHTGRLQQQLSLLRERILEMCRERKGAQMLMQGALDRKRAHYERQLKDVLTRSDSALAKYITQFEQSSRGNAAKHEQQLQQVQSDKDKLSEEHSAALKAAAADRSNLEAEGEQRRLDEVAKVKAEADAALAKAKQELAAEHADVLQKTKESQEAELSEVQSNFSRQLDDANAALSKFEEECDELRQQIAAEQAALEEANRAAAAQKEEDDRAFGEERARLRTEFADEISDAEAAAQHRLNEFEEAAAAKLKASKDELQQERAEAEALKAAREKAQQAASSERDSLAAEQRRQLAATRLAQRDAQALHEEALAKLQKEHTDKLADEAAIVAARAQEERERLERELALKLEAKELALQKAEADERALASERDEVTAQLQDTLEARRQSAEAAQQERDALLAAHELALNEAREQAAQRAAADKARADEAHRARVDALEKHLARERAERESAASAAEQQLVALKEQMDAVARSDAERLETEGELAAKARAEMEASLGDTRASLAESRRLADDLKREAEAAALRAKVERERALADERQRMQALNEEIAAEKRALQSELNNELESRDAALALADDRLTEIETTRAELSRLEQALSEQDAAHAAEVEKLLDSERQAIADAKARADENESVIDLLRQDVDALRDDVQKGRSALASADRNAAEEQAKLQEELRKMQEAHEEERVKANNELAEQLSASDAQQKQISQLRQELHEQAERARQEAQNARDAASAAKQEADEKLLAAQHQLATETATLQQQQSQTQTELQRIRAKYNALLPKVQDTAKFVSVIEGMERDHKRILAQREAQERSKHESIAKESYNQGYRDGRRGLEAQFNNLKDELVDAAQKHASEKQILQEEIRSLQEKLKKILSTQLKQQQQQQPAPPTIVKATPPPPRRSRVDVDAAARETLKSMTKSLMRHEKHCQRLQSNSTSRRFSPNTQRSSSRFQSPSLKSTRSTPLKSLNSHRSGQY